jgi:hypothetical protein
VGDILQAVHLFLYTLCTLLNSFTAGLAILEDALASDICGTVIKLHGAMTFTFMQLLEKLLV